MGFTHTLGMVVLIQSFYQNVYGQNPVFRDDYKYVKQTQSFYKFHTARVGWREAVDTCVAEGATLFYPVNDCEADIVLMHWSQTPAYGWAYIGVSSLNKRLFETVDGNSIWNVYSKWRPGEPNNASGQEKCVVFLRDGTLNDVQCDKNFAFICKKKSDSNNGKAVCDRVQNNQTNTKFRKDYQYQDNSNSFYKIHTVQHIWRDAENECNKEGAVLFYPKNKCEVNVVLEFWNQTQPFDKVFVGISSLSKGSFQTIDGHSLWEVYNEWRPGEPNNANGNEQCVVLSRDGLFNDVRCALNFPFICKKPGDLNKRNVLCNEVDAEEKPLVNFRKDYKYLQDTQSVYKIHTIFQNWQDSKATCENEGSTLFFPENECEANVVLEFWNKTQPFGWVYIGVYNPTTEASILNFDTIDGRRVYEIFNTWRRGEPNNINGEEHCVVLQREGTLNDDRCDKKYAFICKKAISKGNAYCDDVEKSKKFRKDYKFIEDTQSFYKMHGSFKNWQDAKETCQKEGGFLFYPENTCEANIILDFWSQNQPSRRIHVGISSPSRGYFETVNGGPIWKIYSKWRPGEPNNEYDIENCVILHRDNFEYGDEKCGQKLPFICKKKLEPRRSGIGCDVHKIDDSSVVGFRTDYTYLEDTQSLYKMHTIFENFDTSKKICEEEGATLFYPENKCEFDAVIDYWSKTYPIIIDTVLIGVKRNNERIFESIDGRRLPNLYIEWGPNEPNNANNEEDCIVLYRLINNFNDIKCDRKFAFTCKKKIDSVDRDAFCDTSGNATEAGGSVSTDYRFLNDTQNFYKFHKKARNWPDANKICAKEGATLFYPTNKCEANAVLNFWGQTEQFGSVLIGLSSSGEGTFKTVDDKSGWDVYNNWRPGEPNNANDDEKCVELLRDETLNDVSCFQKYLFICKKEPKSRTAPAFCDETENDKKTEVAFRKDYTYLSDTQSFYKIHTISHSWQDAKEVCTKEKAVLFYPENSCEANAVLEFWNQTQTFGSIYVGILSPSTGVFETVNGRPVWQVYNKWRPGEPNNANGKEGCVAFTSEGTYNDVQCKLNFPFICKKKVSSSLNIATCDKPETGQDLGFRKDYQYIKETKSFYKIQTILQPWQEAKDACTKEETSLFYPEDELEANAVLEFWKQTQPFGWIYIGVYNPTKDTSASINNFKTIDGRPVKEVYNKWRVGEPNNANGEENCVTLSLDGTLTDDRCSQNYAFVCKIKIDTIKETPVKSDAQVGNREEIVFRKDYTYFKDTSSFYKIHSTFLSWNNAKQMCMKEGAALFYPENSCEATVVLNYWSKTQIFRRAFIGVYSPAKAVFETIDGTPIWLVYNNWRTGEPDDANGNEKCVTLNRDGTMNDDKCDAKIPFICKKKIDTAERSHCSKQDLDKFSDEKLFIQKDYTYLENTKNLYKIHTIQQNWYDARKTCLNEGATLFYPENKCELDTVIEFWNKLQSFVTLYLGISSEATGSFETVDGRQVWEVYNVWRRGEPNNVQDREGCVVISRETAMYNDDNCNTTHPFICKKKTETQIGAAMCDKSVTDTYKKQINILKDYTYLDDARSMYKIHTIFRSWNDAKETCFKEQASLFYPIDENEFKIVQDFWNQTQDYKEVFIGVSLASRGTFNTVNGSQITNVYNKWAPGKPMIANTKNGCVLLRRDGTLDEDYCTNNHPFICKKTLEMLNWNVFCNTADVDYRYNAAQKHCYKFHLTPMNWSDAFASCKAENSYLAVINGKAEAEFLVKLTARAPKDGILGNYLAGAVHLGFYKQKDFSWKTVTGQLLIESGYAHWGYNQPDGGAGEPCGSMFYNGQLNDIGCSQRCFFICEHEINSLDAG